MEFRPLLQGETPGVGMGIRSLHNSVQQPRKSGSLVEMGRVWMVGAQGLRKGRPLSPSWDLALRAFSPPLSPREWRRGRQAEAKVRCRGS